MGGYLKTSSEMVVVSLVLPLVPVMVMVLVPVVARLLSVMVIFEVPAPVIEEGLKDMVVPLASPEAESAMVPLNPPVTAEVMVTEPELPRSMLIEVGEALREKPAVGLVTVSETVAVSVTPSPVPVIVIV